MQITKYELRALKTLKTDVIPRTARRVFTFLLSFGADWRMRSYSQHRLLVSQAFITNAEA
jgi:hypothetical protein